eukprot:scaffold434_cov358-Prasinococcus_capsulatus_cf.AAC.1
MDLRITLHSTRLSRVTCRAHRQPSAARMPGEHGATRAQAGTPGSHSAHLDGRWRRRTTRTGTSGAHASRAACAPAAPPRCGAPQRCTAAPPARVAAAIAPAAAAARFAFPPAASQRATVVSGRAATREEHRKQAARKSTPPHLALLQARRLERARAALALLQRRGLRQLGRGGRRGAAALPAAVCGHGRAQLAARLPGEHRPGALPCEARDDDTEDATTAATAAAATWQQARARTTAARRGRQRLAALAPAAVLHTGAGQHARVVALRPQHASATARDAPPARARTLARCFAGRFFFARPPPPPSSCSDTTSASKSRPKDATGLSMCAAGARRPSLSASSSS